MTGQHAGLKSARAKLHAYPPEAHTRMCIRRGAAHRLANCKNQAPTDINCETQATQQNDLADIDKRKCNQCMLYTDDNAALEAAGARIPTMRIIPGPEEAFRGWLTAQYLHRLFLQLRPRPANAGAPSIATAVEFLGTHWPVTGGGGRRTVPRSLSYPLASGVTARCGVHADRTQAGHRGHFAAERGPVQVPR